jgi:hypothetical protein
MAVRLGYDSARLRTVCRRFAARVMQTLRRQVKHAHGLRSSADLHAGVMVVVQRFRSDLGLYVHLHGKRSANPSSRPSLDHVEVVRR